MKGPGLQIDVDVRRAWKCPTCGRLLRLGLEATAPRCFCVRDGVRMKLIEDPQWGKKLLRPEVRAVLDRIQAGEEFPRLQSLISSDGQSSPREGGPAGEGGRSRNRPPRPPRGEPRPDRPPRGRPDYDHAVDASKHSASPETVPAPVPATQSPPIDRTPQLPSTDPITDDFGAGLGIGEPPPA